MHFFINISYGRMLFTKIVFYLALNSKILTMSANRILPTLIYCLVHPIGL